VNSEQKYNLLIISATLGIGGLETYVVNVLKCLNKKLFQCTVVYCGGKNDYQKEIENQGVDVLFVPYSYIQIPYMFKIGRIIAQRKIDILCDFGGDFAAPAILTAKFLGVKSRTVMYRSSRYGFRNTILKDMYASALRKIVRVSATGIIGNTRKVLSSFYPDWQSKGPPFEVVHNGVDLEKLRGELDRISVRRKFGIKEDAFIIGHVGRLHESKNHTAILEAFAKMHKTVTGTSVLLLLVGEGPLREKIEADISRLQLADAVIMTGQRRDIPDMLGAMDVFIFPSIYEGMPNALVEAMGQGLPFVASNIEEISEIVPQQLQCQLYKPNDITGIANGLYKLCTDKDCRQRVATAGEQWARQNYNIQNSCNKLVNSWLRPLMGRPYQRLRE
jgi:glycosyltransferase involved in cell wall biosynthesis